MTSCLWMRATVTSTIGTGELTLNGEIPASVHHSVRLDFRKSRVSISQAHLRKVGSLGCHLANTKLFSL